MELQNVSKKKNTVNLTCADGCDLIFKNTCHYYNRNGTEVIRQAHFAHKTIASRDTCLALRKYRSGGGESDEHYQTKMNIAKQKNLKFVRQCADSDCNRRKRKHIPSNCYTAVEYKVNKRWLVDVAFFDKASNELKMVVEVKHKHAVDGQKREWLIKQNFLYFEVGCNIKSNTHLIIDSSGVFYCTSRQQKDSSFEGTSVCECYLGAVRREQRERYRRQKEEERRLEEEKKLREEIEREKERYYALLEKQRQEKERSRFAVIIQSIWRSHQGRKLVKKIKSDRYKYSIFLKQMELLKKKEEERRRKRLEKEFIKKIYAEQNAKQDAEEKLQESKKERQRQKQQEKRQELKAVALQKKTVEYQKMINKNRQAFGLKKRKLQSNIGCFFKKHKT
jgi:hypothetical protein